MLYKILNDDGTSCNGGTGQWSLPTKNADNTWTPGDWMPAVEDELVACENGYHLAQDAQVLEWLGPAIFEAEYRGECLDAGNKVVVREARLLRRFENWNERTARLFACDCAERVLPLFEKDNPADTRPREAIETARQYANGQATDEELAAAWDAAWDAARDAARDAAWAAAWDATWDAARAAAWAARAAAWAAARDATWDAARDAAREWQYARLLELLMSDEVVAAAPATDGKEQ